MRKQWIRWLPFVVVVVEAVLYAAGVLTLGQAALVLVVLEGLLAVVVVGELALLLRAYRGSKRAGAGRARAFSQALDEVLPRPIAFLVRHEFGVFAALAGFLARRRSVHSDDRVIPYGGRMAPLVIVMAVVSLIELAVVEMFLPWAWLRLTLLIVGCYGLLWVLGFASSTYTRPHSVSATTLRLRMTFFADVAVPTASVLGVGGAHGSHESSVEVRDGTLALSVLGMTNVVVQLAGPVEVDLRRTGRHSVTAVRFYADDPAGAAAAIREVACLQVAGR